MRSISPPAVTDRPDTCPRNLQAACRPQCAGRALQGHRTGLHRPSRRNDLRHARSAGDFAAARAGQAGHRARHRQPRTESARRRTCRPSPKQAIPDLNSTPGMDCGDRPTCRRKSSARSRRRSRTIKASADAQKWFATQGLEYSGIGGAAFLDFSRSEQNLYADIMKKRQYRAAIILIALAEKSGAKFRDLSYRDTTRPRHREPCRAEFCRSAISAIRRRSG